MFKCLKKMFYKSSHPPSGFQRVSRLNAPKLPVSSRSTNSSYSLPTASRDPSTPAQPYASEFTHENGGECLFRCSNFRKWPWNFWVACDHRAGCDVALPLSWPKFFLLHGLDLYCPWPSHESLPMSSMHWSIMNTTRRMKPPQSAPGSNTPQDILPYEGDSDRPGSGCAKGTCDRICHSLKRACWCFHSWASWVWG